MIFEIQNKDETGRVIFSGTLNKSEAEFVLNVGLNYLVQQGAAKVVPQEKPDEAPSPT